MKEFSLDEIISCVKTLNITFQVIGGEKARLKFASLRHIEPKGIYFLEKFSEEIDRKIFDSVIVTNEYPESGSTNTYIVVQQPQIAFYKVSSLLNSSDKPVGIHPTAIVDEKAQISERSYIGPYSVIGCAIIGSEVYIDSHVTIKDNVSIGDGSVIESHSTIGATGVAWVWDENGERIRQPQTGGVHVGKNVFLGASTVVVRGSINENTIIGDQTMIAPGCKIGHSVVIGEKCHLANNIAVGGSVRIGSRSFLGSGSVIRPQVQLAAGTIVGAGAVVVKSLDEENRTVAGVPAREVIINDKESPSGMPKPFKNYNT